MKINNANVTGVYYYSDSSTYTPGDLVILDGIIYVCQEEIFGVSPDGSDKFRVYLGNKSVDIKEYLEFLETGEGENKYLSTLVLQQALNHFMLGPDGKGIIGDYVKYDSETGSYETGFTLTDPESPLGEIMVDPDINHALIRVSRNLPEVRIYASNQGPDDQCCLLRQYTYLHETTGHKIRIQELIDPVDGLIYFRSADISTDVDISGIGSFRCAISNPGLYKNRFDQVMGIYESRLKLLDNLTSHLKSNFRYRRVDLTPGMTSFEFDDTQRLFPEMTVMITEVSENGVRKNTEISFSLSDQESSGVWPKYGIGSYILEITPKGDDNSYLISLSGKNIDSSKVWFSGAYYREYYEI